MRLLRHIGLEEIQKVGPVLDKKRLARLGVSADELQWCAFRIRGPSFRSTRSYGVPAPLFALLAFLAFDDLDPALGHQAGIVEPVRVRRIDLRMQAEHRVDRIALGAVERGDLVHRREQRLIKALVVQIALLDVAEMSLAVEGGGIARLGQHLGDGDFLGTQSRELMGHTDHAHAVPHRVATRQNGSTGGRARRLRVHPGEVDPLGGHPVHVGRLVAEVLLEAGKADGTERRVVPQNVDDVRRLPVLLPSTRPVSVSSSLSSAAQLSPFWASRM